MPYPHAGRSSVAMESRKHAARRPRRSACRMIASSSRARSAACRRWWRYTGMWLPDATTPCTSA
jgi:hypothetical protein